ncbi:MAG: hypothetical protein EHM12_10540, partial [Dehalococcoidia bacterium]
AENDALCEVMTLAATEVANVAAAQGIHLPFSNVATRVVEVCRATANNRSSMLQDVSRAARTEIDAISGAVVRFGQRFNVPTPINELLWRLVKEKERLNVSTLNVGVLNVAAIKR